MKIQPDLKIFLSSVLKLYDFTKKSHKSKVLSIVARHFTASILRAHGFVFSSDTYYRAKTDKVWEDKHFFPASKRKISLESKKRINQFLRNNSTIASNRTKQIFLSEFIEDSKGKFVCDSIIMYFHGSQIILMLLFLRQ